MIRMKGKGMLMLAAIAVALSGMGTAYGQYSASVGTAPGGGNTVIGSGTGLGNLGPGSPLSNGGGDSITFLPGSFALGSGSDTVQIQTPNESLTNQGIISSPMGTGQYGFNAISFTMNVSNETVTNTGSVYGGLGATGEFSYYGGTGGNALYIYTSGNVSGFTLKNSGQLVGGQGGNGTLYYAGTGGSGLYLSASGTAGNFTIMNSGLIAGGNGGTTSPYGYGGGGPAIYFDAGVINGFALNNTGSILGGVGTPVTVDDSYPSEGGDAMDIYGTNGINGFTINNSGLIAGGLGGNFSGSYAYGDYYGGGYGVYLDSTSGGINGFTLNNSGTISGANGPSGGNYGYIGSRGGTALSLLADGDSGNIIVNNSGLLLGGNGGDATGIFYTYDDLYYTYGYGGVGIYMSIGGNLSDVSINNTGSIIGGNAGNQVEPTGYYYLYGASGGDGIYVSVDDAISNMGITNAGKITGGNGGNVMDEGDFYYAYSGGAGGNGIEVDAGSVSGLTINNASMGYIAGGNGGSSNYYSLYLGKGGAGISLSATNLIMAVAINNAGTILAGAGGASIGIPGDDEGGNGGAGINVQASSISGLSIYNATTGVITGGNGGNADYGGGLGGAGIYLSGVQQATVTNFGAINGGKGGAGSDTSYYGAGGYGVYSSGNGLTLNNWGAINAGIGNPNAATTGFPNVAVYVNGSNNTINLNGHSSVNGTLEGANSGSNNVLNLNFTGMTPAAIAALKAQLASQGWPGTNDFTGTFTVRGVTYYIDPLVLNLNVSSYQLQGLTPSQQAVGASLDSVTSNPAPGSPLGNLYNAIDLSGNVPLALEALSPQQYQVFGDLAIQNTTAMVQNLDARLNNIRDGSESIDTSGLGGNGGTTTAQAAESELQTTAGYSKDDGKSGKDIVQTAPPERRWGMFATGDGLFFRGNPHDVDVQGVKSNDAGTLAGLDAKIGDHAVAGAFFSDNNSSAQLGSDNSHATIESYSGGLYGSYHQDGFFANGVAAYTHNRYSTDRDIVFPGFASDATGSTSGNQESVNLDGGYDWHATDRVTLGPIAGLQYVHLDVDGFNEAGAGAANLAISSQEMNSLQSRVGGRADYHLLTSQTSSFAAELHAAWQHEFLDDSRGIGASFIGDGLTPFSVQTSSPLRDAGVVGLGLNFTFHDRLTLFADYELLMWRSSDFEQTINGGGRISF